jgi:hypothetical protein
MTAIPPHLQINTTRPVSIKAGSYHSHDTLCGDP